jgi:hypothetical protein
MTSQERSEYEDEVRLLKELHRIYLGTPQLGGNEDERTEHLLVIMERIYDIQQLLNSKPDEPTNAPSLD